MNIFELPIHPQADIFPMLPKTELQELADDIKTNGLNVPIVIAEHDGKMHLIDGRNRREACKMANVKPTHQELNGKDQTAYIASSNLNRRHMTKSQRAMAMAMLYPGGSGKGANPKNMGFHSEYLRMARKVLRVLPMKAKEVLAGYSLPDAYKLAQDEEKESTSMESQMTELRNEFPDLADRVDTEEITFVMAKAESDERKNEARLMLKSHATTIKDLFNAMVPVASEKAITVYCDYVVNHKNEFKEDTGLDLEVTVSAMKLAIKHVSELINEMEETK